MPGLVKMSLDLNTLQSENFYSPVEIVIISGYYCIKAICDNSSTKVLNTVKTV